MKKFPAFLEVTNFISQEYRFHIATSLVILCYIFVLWLTFTNYGEINKFL